MTAGTPSAMYIHCHHRSQFREISDGPGYAGELFLLEGLVDALQVAMFLPGHALRAFGSATIAAIHLGGHPLAAIAEVHYHVINVMVGLGCMSHHANIAGRFPAGIVVFAVGTQL